MADRRRRSGSRPRTTTWTSNTSATESAIAAATKVLVANFVLGGPITIMRVRGLLTWRSDQVTVDEVVMGAFGLCLVTESAITAGVASIPGPFTNADDDVWFAHQFVYDRLEFQSGTGVGQGMTTHVQYDLDSKAMRKGEDGQSVAVVWENGHASSGATATENFRMLFKLVG